MVPEFARIKLVVADLDGTLARSKMPIDSEMEGIICELLRYKDLAVLSGGSFKQFKAQLINKLQNVTEMTSHIYLFPTCATSMYAMNKNGAWEEMYSETLKDTTKKQIFNAFAKALKEVGFEWPEKTYGEILEDRGSQVTFSAFGQSAPIELKEKWDPDGSTRREMVRHLVKYLPSDVEARIGGTTSIDVTRRGIDKAYGIKKIEEKLRYARDEMIFIGDRLLDGGNDHPVLATGVRCIFVSGPAETKKLLKRVISESVRR